MSGPWEKYQQAAPMPQGTPAPSAKPWEKYAQNSQKQAAPEIVQEMPDDVSFGERFIAQNLANSDEAKAAYLKQEHPDMEVKAQDGQILMRKPGEKAYKVLDPHTGFFSKDILNDAADLTADAASTVATGVGDAVGALGGAAVAGPVGAVPGAMAGGAAASGGAEALRQKLGQWAGIPQNVNNTDVMVAGGAGAAGPLLFGAGRPSAAAIEGLMAKGLSKEAAVEKLAQSARGAIERGWDYIPSKIGSLASGVPQETIKDAFKNMDQIDNWSKHGIENHLVETTGKIRNWLDNQLTENGQKLNDVISSAKDKVNLQPIKERFQAAIAKAQQISNELGTPESKARVEELTGAYDNLLGREVGAPKQVGSVSVPGISGEEAGRDVFRPTPERPNIAPTNVPIVDDPTQRLDPNTMKMVSTPKEVPDEISAPAAWQLQQDLKDPANLTAKVGAIKGRPAGKASNELANAAEAGYGHINKELERVTGGQSQEFKNLYSEKKAMQDQLQNNFGTEQKTYNTLANLDSKNNTIIKERLQRAAQNGQFNVVDDAKAIQAYDKFGDAGIKRAGLLPMRAIPAGAVGAGLGYLAGDEVGHSRGAAAVGSLTGLAIGAMMGNPASIRAAIRAGLLLEQGGKFVPTPLMKGALPAALTSEGAQSIWDRVFKAKGDQ